VGISVGKAVPTIALKSGSSPDELREEVFTLMNKQFDTFRAQVEAVLNRPQSR